GRQLAIAAGCTSCHMENGISKDPLVPNLAGQKLKYLRKQMNLFVLSRRQDTKGEMISERSHPIMSHLTRYLTPKDTFQILSYYASLECELIRPIDWAKTTQYAETCEICHGGIRSNPFRDSPHLAGQKTAYLKKQMAQMIESAKNKNLENDRYHRLTELMVYGISADKLERAINYYGSFTCFVKQ
ncbi:MAG: c-type cytochrome, partial [Alphaproteobacteria bacterium]|nr:c-type cytochrome [Alphaproteobacteria bacterium]